jgi:hypothetical protein
MAQIKTTITRPAREEERVIGLICDLCGAKSETANDWRDPPFGVNDVQICHFIGTHYPEDGYSAEGKIFDLCPDCFENKLVPWLESQGAKPRTESC